MDNDLGFVLVVEHGELEAKAALLVASIRRVPALRTSPIYVIQPRSGRLPTQATLQTLAEHDAQFIFSDLNRSWVHHGPMNKVFAAALAESLVDQCVDTLYFLDSDTLVIDTPERLAVSGTRAAVSPIAQWSTGKIGQIAGQPISAYWSMIFDVCGMMEPPTWTVTTTIDRRTILPYFNSGVVAVRPSDGLFRSWHENVERLACDKRARDYPIGSREYFFLDQVMLAGTLAARLPEDQIRIQNHRFNYPLPAHNLLPDGERAATLEEIVILHYHSNFYNLYWLDDIGASSSLNSWLMDRLPLRPPLRLRRSTPPLYLAWLMSHLPHRPLHHRLMTRLPVTRSTVPARRTGAG